MSQRIIQGPKLEKSINFDDITLGDFFLKQAKKFPERICQIDADLDRSETFASVISRSIRLATQLQKEGISSSDVITCCSYNSLDTSIAIFATLLLGAKITNLDPTLSPRNTKHLLQLVTPKLVFSDLESLVLIETCLKDSKIDAEIVVFGNSDTHTQFDDLVALGVEIDFVPPKVDVNDVALMFFSSGTTGLPKAICHSHFTIMKALQIYTELELNMNIGLHYTSMYWITGLIMLFVVFIKGDTRVFARTMEGEQTFKLMEKYKITYIFLAPIYTYKLTSVENPHRYDYSSLRTFITGGTPISEHHFKKLKSLFPRATILLAYGLSELGTVSVFDPKTDKHLIDSKIGSCGKVAPNVTVKIVDPENEEVLGPHCFGEIRVKTPVMTVGYYKQDYSDNFDGDGFLKTGDVGYYDEDVCIYVVDRIKEMFKYLSWHIVPSALESVLGEHPAVLESVVVGIPAGEEGETPAACIVLKEEYKGRVTKEELEKFVTERVSDRERLRGGIIFVESLPRTPTGKLLRNQIKNTIISTL